ncbi:MAG: hypothetical protein K2L96_01330 [Muribaculaceae bacterium]|nr:hypothetical protein [Muribaculaceae bacterium]
MNTTIFSKLRLATVALMAFGGIVLSPCVHADDYDDDLYYSPAKAEKQKKEAAAKQRAAAEKARKEYEARIARQDSMTAAYSEAHPMSGLDMNVDSYNRHGSFLVGEMPADTTGLHIAGLTDFAYTRRIERFHNDSIVTQNPDEELQEYYYAATAAQENPTVVNIYVNNGWPYSSFYGGYYAPRYGWPWVWNYAWNWGLGWYDPWFDMGWGLGWSWNWGWNWGPGWGPNPWYPGMGWIGPSNQWRPSGIPGASRPHGYASGNARPNNLTPSGSVRPGNMGRGRVTNGNINNTHEVWNSSLSQQRPGGVNSSNHGTQDRPVISGASGRGRSNYNSGQSQSSNSNYSPSRSSSSSSRSSSSSFGSSSRGSSFSGGGGSRGGGGASRGRGR